MIVSRLKRYLPRMPSGIYGRAALILLMPIVLLQIVVSFAFIRRDLEDITKQMAQTMVREFVLIGQEIARSESQQDALQRLQPILGPLNVSIRFLDPGEAIPPDLIPFEDFSGRIVRETFSLSLPQFQSIQLPRSRRIRVVIDSAQGPASLEFNRRRVSAAAPHQLIVTMVVFGFLLVVIAMAYMRNQLRPIKRLADAAEAFGRGRMIPYQPRGAIEVRAAGAAFIDMRARIERQIEQRTLMLSGVSHDLRTPLTRLKLTLSMLDGEDISAMEMDVKEMEDMVDAFLDFARGVTTSAMEEVDPCELVEDAVQSWARQGQNVLLVEVVGNRRVPLRTAAVRRAVDNLISNAVRYGSRARVSVAVMQKSLRIRVEDDGPGIPEDLRGDAIRPFTRLDPARNQDLGTGVGLGLAIVADIARAHGGTLRLGNSEALGGLQADIVIAL
ncbi:ATP-binding protein [Tritonibacter horizontis]|uniref:histidine kinase n=1 Tax=Tritonibacter horizontis TaxID=1768241 RepID=A0A132BXB9_9RHOB|nr:ATP-binding protein [Tritonibacter horizontis]KUP92702.1 osmolarity sensor protein EnvZ [Tritonibacter horizontis]